MGLMRNERMKKKKGYIVEWKRRKSKRWKGRKFIKYIMILLYIL